MLPQQMLLASATETPVMGAGSPSPKLPESARNPATSTASFPGECDAASHRRLAPAAEAVKATVSEIASAQRATRPRTRRATLAAADRLAVISFGDAIDFVADDVRAEKAERLATFLVLADVTLYRFPGLQRRRRSVALYPRDDRPAFSLRNCTSSALTCLA